MESDSICYECRALKKTIKKMYASMVEYVQIMQLSSRPIKIAGVKRRKNFYSCDTQLTKNNVVTYALAWTATISTRTLFSVVRKAPSFVVRT